MENDGEKLFENLCDFICRALALPVSNVDAERLFSKTPIRNGHSIDTARDLIHISEFTEEFEACYEVEPTEKMLDIMK